VTAPHDATYTLRGIQQMLNLSRRVLAGLIGAGFVTPARGPRNEYRFTFQDVVLLRTAHALRSASIPPRRILRSLEQLRASLPEQLPLSGLRITAVGGEIAVRDGAVHWTPGSGQLLLDFDVSPVAGEVRLLARTVEAPDLSVDAALDRSAQLCENGQSAEALQVCELALERHPDEPLLHFNRAVALEDLGKLQSALDSYERCLVLDPSMADAHFNAARIHEALGHEQQALKHFSAYRRLAR
jgi:tetratricopeptide (TPR) repeat protein